MFTKHANQELDNVIIVHWLLMTFCAGIINSVALIGLGTFVTHVTGFATLIGVNIASFQIGNALKALAVPIFFLIGSVVSGICVEGQVRQDKKPQYDYVMYACCVLLLTACAIGKSNQPQYGSAASPYLKNNFLVLSLLSLSSGLINAALSYSSHSTVRITHLTGVTTDLGRGIAELISLRMRNIKGTRTELRLNLLRMLTIFSFIIGGIIGAILFHAITFYVLMIPVFYFAYAGERGRKINGAFIRINSIGVDEKDDF
jgi:uncharacterized membrane protein YoaK (UPF0700 family)